MRNILNLIILLGTLIFFSCTDHTPKPNPEPEVLLEKPGVFVVNEGNYTFGNSSLTYYNTDKNKLYPDVFYFVNQVPLGDVANFMAIKENLGYIVVNNSGIIYKIDISTGIYEGKVTGLISPREVMFLDNKMIISDIVDPYLSVVDLKNLTVESKIDLDGYTSESMILVNNKIYVNNWSAMYQEKRNDQVLVIDAETLKLVDSIKVVLEPNSMAVDKYDNLWVLCSGGYMNEESPSLLKIDTQSDSIMVQIDFIDENDYPTELKINGAADTLYFFNKDLYKMSINDSVVPDNPFIESEGKLFYSMGIDPFTSDVFISDALNYTQKGKVYIYSSGGSFKTEFFAGISPGCFVFNR